LGSANDGAAEGLSGTSRDADGVTFQQSVDLAEQRYRRLVDHSPDAICVHEGGRLVYVNPAGARWMAAESSDQLVGHSITEFVHPDSIAPMLARIAALRCEGDSSSPSDAVLLRFDGTTLDVEAVSVLTAWEGKPAYQVIFRDLTAQKAAQATLRYQAALVNHVSDALIATTSTGIVTSWNPAAETIYRRPATQALARPITETVGAPLDPAVLVAGGGVVHTTHYTLDRSPLAVRVSAAAMDYGYVLVCADQTALRRAEQHFQTVVSALDEGVIVLGKDRRVESVNPAALRILGLQAGDVAVHAVRTDVIPVYDADGKPLSNDERPIEQILSTQTPITGYVVGADRPDGQRVWLSVNCRLLIPTDPDHSAVLISFTDITAQHTARESLVHQATHDALTGLPNRTNVVARAAEALICGNEHALAAVLFMDLDNLKDINDSLGHHAGDELLKIAAQRLRRAVRTDDMVGRLGGDEFVALLTGPLDRADLDQLAERLHATLEEPVVIAGVTLHTQASIGIVAVEPDDARDAAALLRDADLAMYRAKTTGGGRTHHFTEQLRV
jgi:diguanylate cyclase (GGDEF)-like protein/PAS domain S-box-containing protein